MAFQVLHWRIFADWDWSEAWRSKLRLLMSKVIINYFQKRKLFKTEFPVERPTEIDWTSLTPLSNFIWSANNILYIKSWYEATLPHKRYFNLCWTCNGGPCLDQKIIPSFDALEKICRKSRRCNFFRSRINCNAFSFFTQVRSSGFGVPRVWKIKFSCWMSQKNKFQ